MSKLVTRPFWWFVAACDWVMYHVVFGALYWVADWSVWLWCRWKGRCYPYCGAFNTLETRTERRGLSWKMYARCPACGHEDEI